MTWAPTIIPPSPYFNSEHAKYAHGQLFASDALLLGRVTYQGMASAWPHMEDSEGEFAVRMNSLPKHVVSTTVEQSAWNATVVRGDLATEVGKLKEHYTKDILVYASGELTNVQIALGLVDELKLWVHPVVLGEASGCSLRALRRPRGRPRPPRPSAPAA
ncbi:dihydrofolate reductase family protein [Streptomyces capitiformicae]|uniref:Bacterial bifunctional deaminase-reductase C-terminal domain-containing protein n=1 Tax=Streptomyces capitiformicae TaxID=2014920 RepID=A0A918ZQA5_9ACTN|nr:dihydrofolate reductase family protein [Streptomyces capitiformicae]GHE64380.1 hypothetical protein GCM10017771_87890 [Streptomyces capitiformicae]